MALLAISDRLFVKNLKIFYLCSETADSSPLETDFVPGGVARVLIIHSPHAQKKNEQIHIKLIQKVENDSPREVDNNRIFESLVLEIHFNHSTHQLQL